jgi:hypothetical protein
LPAASVNSGAAVIAAAACAWSAAAFWSSATDGGSTAATIAAASTRMLRASAATALSRKRSVPNDTALARIAKAKSPATGQRAATGMLDEGIVFMPAPATQWPPMSAERTTVSTGPNQLGRKTSSKAR